MFRYDYFGKESFDQNKRGIIYTEPGYRVERYG